MKSTIRIDFVDLGEGQGVEPVISIHCESSEDPRDKLLKTLMQSCPSGYLKINWRIGNELNRTGHDFNQDMILHKDPIMEQLYTQVGGEFFPECLLKPVNILKNE